MKITARTLHGQACQVEFEDHVFKKITPLKDDILDLPWIAPGLIDIQINGFAGIDFNRAIASDDAWRHATQTLYAHGCTGFLATLITNTEEGYRPLLRDLTGRINLDPHNCLGFHLEGPWLNPAPEFRGAHRAEWMQKPRASLLAEWLEIAGPLLKLITLAPEMDPEASRQVIQAGLEKIAFFIGHSGAMGSTLGLALDSGAVGWTHLGNAAPASAPKFENVILHALSQPNLYASLIPDGLHVPPHAFRVLARALQKGHHQPRFLLTTDAMAGAAAGGPGRYTLGEVEVQVGADGAARLPTTDSEPLGRLAGSTLTPFQGVGLAERMAGLFLEDAWTAFSSRPASLLGLTHGIAEGNRADFCLLSPESVPYLLATYHRGKCVFEAP